MHEAGDDPWSTEEHYWAENFTSRPYGIGADFFDRYRPAYRYGWESARRQPGRSWDEAEPELRSGWDTYEHRGEHRSAWEEIRDAVKDAWDRAVHNR